MKGIIVNLLYRVDCGEPRKHEQNIRSYFQFKNFFRGGQLMWQRVRAVRVLLRFFYHIGCKLQDEDENSKVNVKNRGQWKMKLCSTSFIYHKKFSTLFLKLQNRELEWKRPFPKRRDHSRFFTGNFPIHREIRGPEWKMRLFSKALALLILTLKQRTVMKKAVAREENR